MNICELCEQTEAALGDCFCAPCRTQTERMSDEVTDPIEHVLSAHSHLCFLSDIDSTTCRCMQVFEGGPGYHRRHLAEKIYEVLGLPGPSPWILGPDSPTRLREAKPLPTPECCCTRFRDTGNYRIADLTCPVHGASGTDPGDGYWDDDTEAKP